MKFKKLVKKNKKFIFIGLVIIILIIGSLVLIPKPKKTGNSSSGSSGGSSGGQQVQSVPLSQEEINVLGQNILSSPFIKDMPKKGIIGLQFYKFENGQRVWQSGFLIGKNGFLSSGSPDLVLIMHSKYISELNNKNLCKVIQEAEKNNDMWTETKESTAKLLLKYSRMMKYRDCFGF